MKRNQYYLWLVVLSTVVFGLSALLYYTSGIKRSSQLPASLDEASFSAQEQREIRHSGQLAVASNSAIPVGNGQLIPVSMHNLAVSKILPSTEQTQVVVIFSTPEKEFNKLTIGLTGKLAFANSEADRFTTHQEIGRALKVGDRLSLDVLVNDRNLPVASQYVAKFLADNEFSSQNSNNESIEQSTAHDLEALLTTNDATLNPQVYRPIAISVL